MHILLFFSVISVDPSQVGKGVALITVMDINDNAPVFAIEYETFLCENVGPGQVLCLLILQPKGFHIKCDLNMCIVQLNKQKKKNLL